jgi:hypothetical protein
VFTLREPQRAFLKTDHARTMNKFALSSGVYEGLEEVAAAYPTLCLRFLAVLRKLEGLTHFTLAISDDGELTAYDYNPGHEPDEGYDSTDEEDAGHESEAEDIITIGPDQTHSGDSVVNKACDSQRLARLEKLALENMSKGFVRERGNIHFETAMTSVDHREEWEDFLYCLSDNYDEEKRTHPDWVRPKVSIMILRYGLNWLGDYSGPIHIAGDYDDTVLEQEIRYSFESFDSDSMDEVDDFGMVLYCA